ncbi:nucleoid occlusion factor SlmA [Pseudoduganella sp. SL102]|uniref:Nucleoid occlusion factor SlmA n=1 Tax=Pseudoduganella albidiflava TaxID=321983 RepID=A0A411X5I7_9BURK|nr:MULTISPECIES: nucleoid occlusion factor SlmA [Pseudoduganella]QBI04300.1 nucleoid occlusion factor SlmA [Pseudoduganella albidiflava]WBS03141.1 nucleoid occlusion factor SlmA [Pseudoduganella sp. SL102]GGY26146.1 nucleoid occlusion factor SlmA [Pseudoduganella albidiflava]
MATQPSGQRKLQILQALAAMLEHPKGEKITTAALARRLEVSEAALYRHFASKAQMFEGLIDFIETSVFGLINQITERQHDGLAQACDILAMLLHFAANNPGMTRVLIGDALVGEDERLQQRMNGFYDRVELALKGALRQAAADAAAAPGPGGDQERDIAAHASLMVAFVVGRWHRYAKSGFALSPAQDANAQIALLLR